jgi:hypothetical protein
MRGRGIATLVCFALAGCASQSGMGEGTSWNASISEVGASGHSGTASAAPMDGGTHVNVSLSGGSSGGDHPWHVHEGVCESNGPIVGDPGAYPTLRPGASGDATAEAQLNVSLDPEGSYYVNIHQSANQLDTIVGCGELRPNP